MGHAVHSDAVPPLEYVPTGQTWQAPFIDKKPTPQVRAAGNAHSDAARAPVREVKLPVGHWEHSLKGSVLVPPVEKKP